MAATEENLWWYKILHGLVLKQLLRQKIPLHAQILDAGCGTGGMMKYLQHKGYKNLNGIDLSETAISYCKGLNLQVKQGKVEDISDYFKPQQFDVIISNDVLCYFNIDEQQSIIEKYVALLKPNGIILLNLPAFYAFSGIHDLSVGIRHRFRKSDLKVYHKITQFEKISFFYWPVLLSPLIFLIRTKQRITMRFNKNFSIDSDVNLPPKWLNSIFYILTKIELNFSAIFPFGSSIFINLRKHNS